MASPSDHPHLRSITVCPVCGGYKPRLEITCGRHFDNPRTREIAADYEQALARRATIEAAKPLRPNKPQNACDIGLFSDDKDQLRLV